MLRKLSIFGAVAGIFMIPTTLTAQMGSAVNPGVHVGGAVNPGNLLIARPAPSTAQRFGGTRLVLVITRKPACMTAGDVTVTGAAGHLSPQDRSRRAQEVIFDINPNATRGLSACYRSVTRRPTWTTRRF